jgi:hypothetical protein
VGEAREHDLAEDGEGGGFARRDTVLRDGDKKFAEDVVDVGGGEEIAGGGVEISSPRRCDSRSSSSCLAWKAQKREWAGLRNMRQLRPSEK